MTRAILIFSLGLATLPGAAKQDGSIADLNIQTEKHSYHLPLQSNGNENIDPKFLEVRKQILTKLAIALEKLEFGIGSIEWINEKWKISKMKREMLRKQELLKDAPDDIKEILIIATQEEIDRDLQKIEELIERSFNERSHEMIHSILKRVDQVLSNQKQVVAHAQEFGLLASIGAQFILGSNQKGIGGLVSIGISFGYNKATGAFYLDIFRSVEKFESTLMKVTFSAGIAFKAGIVVQGEGGSGVKSKTFYPPAIPGYSNWSHSSFSSGFSSGLTLPPSPFGDLMTYQTITEVESLLNIQISKVYPKWVRVTSPYIMNKTHLLKDYVSRVLKLSNSNKCSWVLVEN
jgi:hypothetical protein